MMLIIEELEEKIFNFLIKVEGIRLKSYKCSAGVWTIGIGNTRYINNEKVKEGEEITLEDAKKLCIDYIKKNIDLGDMFLLLNVNQKVALISFIYNVGQSNYDKSTLKKVLSKVKNFNNIQEKEKQEIIKSWKLWNMVTINNKKVINQGLTKRRQLEIDLFFS